MRPSGIFNINNSDTHVSSYYTISDLTAIINSRLKPDSQITEKFIRTNFSEQIETINGFDVIEEIKNVPKIWKNKKLFYKKEIPKIGFYELVLYNVFLKIIPKEDITLQYSIDGINYDFKIEYNNKKYIIEFDGIFHYKSFRGENIDNPLERFEKFNDNDYKLIIWPYWIQRCERNLKVILGLEKFGLGAIWSSDYHFGEFPWGNSFEIINKLNKQFNIERNKEIGYIYGPNTENRNNPENPVIKEKILNKRAYTWTNDKLIPNGTPNNKSDRNYWLPDKLKE